MALLRLTSPIADIRGSAGGLVYSKNTQGVYLKNQSAALRRRSPAQSRKRVELANAAALWKSLSQDQVNAWNAFARRAAEKVYNTFGGLATLSGFQWFCRIALRMESVSRPFNPDPPYNWVPRPVFKPVLTAFAPPSTTQQLFWTDIFTTGFADHVLYACLSKGPSNKPPAHTMQILVTRQIVYNVPLDFHDEFLARWPNAHAGQVLHVEHYVQLTNGMRSIPARAQITLTEEP